MFGTNIIENKGNNRFNCFLCDYDVCILCALTALGMNSPLSGGHVNIAMDVDNLDDHSTPEPTSSETRSNDDLPPSYNAATKDDVTEGHVKSAMFVDQPDDHWTPEPASIKAETRSKDAPPPSYYEATKDDMV